MYLVPVNTQSKKVKRVYFMLCDFYHNKKNSLKKNKNNKKLTNSHFPPVLPNMQVISASEKKKCNFSKLSKIQISSDRATDFHFALLYQNYNRKYLFNIDFKTCIKKLGQLILKIFLYFVVSAFLSFLKNIIKNYILNNHQFSYTCFHNFMFSRDIPNLYVLRKGK